jgi:anti-sigma factor RsiW
MRTLGQRLGFSLDHRWVPAHLSDYLDGELDARGRARVERHTQLCPQCRRLLQGVREMLDLLRAHPLAREPAPTELVSAVRARLGDARD